MEKIDLVRRAKYYIDKLYDGIDPVSGNEIIGDSVLEQEKIKKCFAFISEVLDELIQNKGEVVSINKKESFFINTEQLRNIRIINKPITVINFVKNINNVIDDKKMSKLSITTINNWLLKKGYLKTEIVPKVIKMKNKIITEKSLTIGIKSNEKIDLKTGEIKQEILLTPEAQEFILNNIYEILNKN